MKHYPVENVYLYTSRHFPHWSYSEKLCLFDNCLVYSTSLVSNNYLGLKNCSVENNFHLLVIVLFPSAFMFRLLSVWNIIQFRMSIFTLHVIFPLVPIQKSSALCDNCLVYSTSLVSNNYLASTSVLLIITFISIENVLFPIAIQFRLLSVWNIIQLRMSIFTLHVIFPLVPIQKSGALCDNCLVYSTSLVSNNYLASTSVLWIITFILLVNVLFPSAFMFRLLSVWNIIQFRMSIFSENFIFSFPPFQKCCAYCDDCLVYSTSLVSNNYLGLNNCSVENNFHLLVKVLFPLGLLFRLLSVWNIIQFRMSIVTLYVIFALVPIQKSCALCDNCLVYSTSLVSNNYLGLNNCSVDNHFHFSSESFVSICSSVSTTVCVKHYPVENVYLYCERHFPLCSSSEMLCNAW